jgi:hypothetical protein
MLYTALQGEQIIGAILRCACAYLLTPRRMFVSLISNFCVVIRIRGSENAGTDQTRGEKVKRRCNEPNLIVAYVVLIGFLSPPPQISGRAS